MNAPNLDPDGPYHARIRKRILLRSWLDHRLGLTHALKVLLDEPIPGGARWAYIFGSGLLFLFLSQLLTGIFLALYYVPSSDHAHTTVAYIVKVVSGGAFLRSFHAYGASAIIVLLVLHIGQTVVYGSYKGRREILWISGCLLFGLMIGMSFTGYLLPWDMKAFFATTVGTNIVGETPVLGGFIKQLMRGGPEMGTLTLSRFFVAHVILLPGALLLLIGSHLFLFRKAGPAGPVEAHPVDPALPTQRFFPRQALMDMALGVVLVAAIAIFATLVPAELGPKADPGDTHFLPRPEWYFLPMFQWLKYWPGAKAIVGTMIIPSLVGGLFVALPFLDRSLERRPLRRPFVLGAFALVFGGLVFLGIQGVHDDQRDPAVAAQLARQKQDMEAFMKTPFQPDPPPDLAYHAPGDVKLLSILAAHGKEIFEGQSCDTCHGQEGRGAAAPALHGVVRRIPLETIEAMLRNPPGRMRQGGMEPVKVPDQDLKDLIEYLASLG